jgi:hypothetical protein
MSEGIAMSDNKEMIEVLAMFDADVEEHPAIKNIVASENVSLPLAFAVKFGFAELTEKGLSELTDTYNYLQELREERGLDSVWDLLDVDEELPQRTMTISIEENKDDTI